MSIDDATTARRKAMAEAIKAKHAKIRMRRGWDSSTYFHELAEAADVAAQEQRKADTCSS